jgi:anti-anti-sigma factor
MTALRIRGRVGLEATTVWLTGELDMVTVKRLRKTVDVQLDGAPARLVIDVAGLTLLASHGVTCLLEIRDAAYRRGVALELTGLLGNQAVERVVSLLGEWDLLLPAEASPLGTVSGTRSGRTNSGTPASVPSRAMVRSRSQARALQTAVPNQ